METISKSDNLTARETYGLIGSDKVEGTAVYRSNGDRVGTIDRLMIDKHSGKVGYAVMSFGGFLGIGNDHYPVPWALLTYNTDLGGYEVNLSDAQLRGAPRFTEGEIGLAMTATAKQRFTPITGRHLIGENRPGLAERRRIFSVAFRAES